MQLKKKLARQRNWLSYRVHGRRPWTRGYFEYKWREIARAIHDPAGMAAFREGRPPPEKFGAGIDERIVEYSWLLSRLPDGAAKLLDAGSALNFEAILTHPKLADKQITIANLNPEPNCFWKHGVSYVFEDIRVLPFLSDSFDLVTCISTLEHIGMDNTRLYTADQKFKENHAEDYLPALAELRRVLKPGGSLFLTVPFGVYHDFGFFQQFNSRMIEQAVAAFAPAQREIAWYKYERGAWKLAREEECAAAEYATADRARENPVLPAAAGAVACLELTK